MTEVRPLRRLFRVVNGGTPTSDEANWGGPIPWATPVDLARVHGREFCTTERTLTSRGLHDGSRSVPPSSLLVSTRAPIGYVAETTVAMAFNQGCRGLVPRVPCDIRYFRYQLCSLSAQLAARGQGSTFQELSAEGLAAQTIHSPTLASQRAIADFLDAETARIDALITKKRRLIQLLEERRTAYVSKAVTEGLDGEPLVHTRNAFAPHIPASWRLLRLRHAVTSIIDTEHKTAPVVEDGRYLVVRTSNVKQRRLVFEDARYTDEVSWAAWTRRGVPRPGDVLFTREAPAGEACVVPPELSLCIGQRVVLLQVNEGAVSGEWLVHSLYSGAAQQFIQVLSNSTTVAHLNMSDIPDIPIAVPPAAEQQRLLTRIRAEVRCVEETTDRLRRQIGLLAEHRQALITAAVTGEVAVPGAKA